jgi:flagellin
MRNAGDAVSLIQTAEGATNEITNMLQRMRELSIQSLNDTNATEQRGYLDLEFQQLKQEIVRIADTSEWNGFPVLNGTAGQPVGERPVYKVTSDGASTAGLTYTAGAVTGNGIATATLPSPSGITKSGSVNVVVSSGATVAVTQGNGSNTERANVTFGNLVAGQTVSLAGRVFTASSSATGAEVAAAFSSNTSSTNGTISGTLTGYTVSSLAGNTLVFTSSTPNSDVADLSNAGTPITSALATLTLADGSTSSFSGTLGTNTITFANSPLKDDAGSLVLATTNVVNGSTFNFSVNRAFTAVPAMASSDILINGVAVGASFAADDKISPSGSAAGSAIARAAAINLVSTATGVSAVVNTNVMTGSAMGPLLSSASGTVTINGFTSAPIVTTANNTSASRTAVVNAINAISAQTGVVAIDSGSDNQGIRLESTADKKGGNIEVAFNSLLSSSSEFAERTGLKEGLQVGTYSLETAVDGALKVTSANTGDWTRAGLRPASYTANQAVINTTVRPIVTTAGAIESLGSGDVLINGVAIRATTANDDKVSNTTSVTSSRSASAIAIAAAINDSYALTGVTAKANAVSTSGSDTTTVKSGLHALFINGIQVSVTFGVGDELPDRLSNVINSINAQQGQHGVLASKSGTGGITLTTPDGRNLSVWYDNSATNASEFGLGLSGGTTSDSALGVTGIASATAASSTAAALYGSVSLTADPAPVQPPAGAAPGNGAPPPYVSKIFTVEAGINGFNTDGDFKSLGFQAGTFGGDVDDATSKMTPPRTTRMSFHVGASANQIISIDLADFGKGGPITGAITGDSDKTPADVQIGTAEGAKAVLAMLDAAMDKVNGARATMGAVMNRLQHVIDNLSNVVVNTEASRSQIQDADYAAASSELSRTQIMKQAATAVLAQANTDQQTVLKLLQ